MKVHLQSAHGYGASGTAKEVSRRAVPGWFDDQHIGVPDTTPTGAIIPPRRPSLHASVVPDTSLDSLKYADFDAGWKAVATVHFYGTPIGKYSTIWGFKPGGAVGNLMELRRVDSAGVRVWRVRVNGVDRPQLKVTSTPHVLPGFHIVGTARWAWSDYDEMIWVRCDDGCCKIEES
jgi:hypothetical protein